MNDNSIFSLKYSKLKNLSCDNIKNKYIAVFKKTLMTLGFVDYMGVLNLKYGNHERYTLNIKSVIDLFFQKLYEERLGIIYFPYEKLIEIIISFNAELNINKTAFEQANNLLKNMLINWYFANNSMFEYPITGIDYIDKDADDLSYIISTSYTVVKLNRNDI